jgi:hypothetical protein
MNDLKRMALILLAIAVPMHAGAASDPPLKADNAATTSKGSPTYKPPLRGAPAGRIGGGTRGATDRESFSLLVLAPDHAGYTTQDQPCLYWYISKPTSYPVELTITERNAVRPLVEKQLKGPETGGIQTVCLAGLDARLRPNVPYKWFVTLVTNADHRSKDILAGGIIERVEPPETLAARLNSSERRNAPFIYAEEGYWYDALGAISGMIEASPNDADLRKQRASLLEQVGLAEAAEAESR